MIRILSALVLLLVWVGAAQAYELRAKSESALNTAQELADIVRRAGEQVGHNIPQSDQIRVHVISEARTREGSSEIIWNHRVELRKLFDSRRVGPYPMGGWLVIYTSESYGVGKEQDARVDLERTAVKFFEDLKQIDPKTQSP